METLLQALLLRFKPIVSKRVGVALGLWGEAGIGKTYLGRQILSQVQCKSLSLHSTVSLAQLVQTLPQSNRLEAWAETTLNRLTKGEHIPSEPAADALADLLSKVAPVVLHLEDLHEVGAERLELIQQLARRVQRSKGVALLVTSRGELPEPIQGMRLEALSPQASKSLLETQMGTALPQEACDWIFARASGNPLFTLEYFRHLTRMGHIWSDGQRWNWRAPQSLAIPQTVEALIEQVLENTPSPLQEAIGAKAMLNRGSSPELWASMAGVSQKQLEHARAELIRQGILSGEEFVHPLYKEVAGQKLPSVQRRAFARRAIAYLQNDPVEAATFVEEAELEPEKTLALLLEAAQVLKSSHNPLQAAQWLAQATHHAHGEEHGKLALEAAQILEQYDLPKATEMAKLAVDHLGNQTVAARLYARLLALQARLPEAIKALHTLMPNPTLEEEIYLHHQANDFVGLFERWHTRPELQSQATPSTLASVAWALSQQGDRAASEALISRALEHPDLSEETRIGLLVSRASNAFIGSEFASAYAVYAQIAEQARALHKPRLLAQNLRNMALCKVGSPEQNIAYLEEALSLYGQIGDGSAYAITQDALGELLWSIGRYEQAEPLLLSSRAFLSQQPPSLYLVDCEYHLSKLYQDWQPPYASILALKHAHAALEYSRQLDNPRKIVFSLYYAAMAETHGGSPRRALEMADEAQVLSEQLTVPVLGCLALAARGHALSALGDPQALAVFQQAYRKTSELGIVGEAQKIGLEIDRIAGDLESARRRLEWFKDRRILSAVKAAQSYFPQLDGEAGGGRREAGGNNQSISGHPILEVLGPIQIRQNDQTQPVRGRKRQELLALLLEARLGGRSEVSRLDLIEVLYSEEGEPKAMDALKQLISSLREVLGQNAILTTSSGYALSEVDSDAEAFLQGGSTDLWRGEYMQGLGLDSDNSADLLYLALKARIPELVSTNPGEAARLGRILLEGQPYDLSSLQLCLQALRATDNYKTLSRLYEGARARLREVGEVLPEKWAEFVS